MAPYPVALVFEYLQPGASIGQLGFHQGHADGFTGGKTLAHGGDIPAHLVSTIRAPSRAGRVSSSMRMPTRVSRPDIVFGLAQGHGTDGFGVGFGAVPKESQAHVEQIGALFRLLAEDDVAFFHAQHVLGFHAEVADAEFGSGSP
jgi:hypothetical protein